MALCGDCFEDFVHPLWHELEAKNDEFWRRFGRHERWDWDDESATLTFTDPSLPTVRINVSIVGTVQGTSWQWSWANRNITASSKLGMEKVREYGEANSLEKLTSGFLEADEYTGWEMTAVAAHILNAPGAYSFPTEHGRGWLLYQQFQQLSV
ncbi:MAG: hypothetical protein JST28_05785 [Acidobacteria bacterium]|nr:hypothetical protein [Acidobacteriota bacterium]